MLAVVAIFKGKRGGTIGYGVVDTVTRKCSKVDQGQLKVRLMHDGSIINAVKKDGKIFLNGSEQRYTTFDADNKKTYGATTVLYAMDEAKSSFMVYTEDGMFKEVSRHNLEAIIMSGGASNVKVREGDIQFILGRMPIMRGPKEERTRKQNVEQEKDTYLERIDDRGRDDSDIEIQVTSRMISEFKGEQGSRIKYACIEIASDRVPDGKELNADKLVAENRDLVRKMIRYGAPEQQTECMEAGCLGMNIRYFWVPLEIAKKFVNKVGQQESWLTDDTQFCIWRMDGDEVHEAFASLNASSDVQIESPQEREELAELIAECRECRA